jgi:hypothetical protein
MTKRDYQHSLNGKGKALQDIENLFKFWFMSVLAMDRRRRITFSVSVGAFMSTLDASIVNISLPTIVQFLNTHLGAVAWVVTGYLIVITGCFLLVERFADLFGQRRSYLLGFFIFHHGFRPLWFFTHDLLSHRFKSGSGIGCFYIDGQWHGDHRRHLSGKGAAPF